MKKLNDDDMHDLFLTSYDRAKRKFRLRKIFINLHWEGKGERLFTFIILIVFIAVIYLMFKYL